MDGGAWMTTGRLEKVDAGAGVAVGETHVPVSLV